MQCVELLVGADARPRNKVDLKRAKCSRVKITNLAANKYVHFARLLTRVHRPWTRVHSVFGRYLYN